MTILYDADIALDALRAKTVVILGFGAQGHAHALNLRDSGIRVIVANRRESANGRSAIAQGFDPVSIEQAIQQADLIVLALPDEVQPEVYRQQIAPHLRARQALGFIHGFNIHYRSIVAPADVDVIMVAPKAAGHAVRTEFARGAGVPGLVAVQQDATGNARAIALAWARGIGCGRTGIIETTFKDETETDLFGEQAVLCGGLTSLMKAGFETLVEAGYPAEVAYFECVHELKLIVDLIYQGGLEHMRRSISNTAEYGDLTRGPRVIGDQTRAAMRQILAEITSGQFAHEFQKEFNGGFKKLKQLNVADREHPVEVIGRALRSKMGWIQPKEPPKPKRV